MSQSCISVAAEIGRDLVRPKDGDRLFDLIEAELGIHERVELDFAGIRVACSSFMNSALGRLYGDRSPGEIERRLGFANIDEVDRELVDIVMRNAERFHRADGDVGGGFGTR